MSDFLKSWQPKNEERGELETVVTYGQDLVSHRTWTHCSEGDTLFIRQNDYSHQDDLDRIVLTRHELYDIIFNYMNTEELAKIIEERKKANKI